MKTLRILNKTTLAAVALLFLFGPLLYPTQAQAGDAPAAPDLKFTTLSLEEGLSSTSILTVLQDHQGFIWVGTHNGGLNRYDGYEFKVYKHDFEDEGSLSNDFVWRLFEDSHNNLWVGTTGGGLDLYDRAKDSFIHYPPDPDDPTSLPHTNIKSFYEDNDGVLWIGSNGGLSRFNQETGEFFTYQHDPDDANSLSDNSVRFILEDRETGLFWLGTRRGGVTVFDRETEQFTRYEFDPDNSTTLSNNAVNYIFQDRVGQLWVSTRAGLNRFDRETETFVRYLYNPDDPLSLSNGYVYEIYEDRKGLLWVGTRDGLNLLDPQTETFSPFYHDPNTPNSISSGFVRFFYQDNTSALWIGSTDGLNYLTSEPEKFATYRHNPGNPNSLTGDSVSALSVDSAGDVWIGTNDGLNHFDGHTFTRYQYDPSDPNSIGANHITAVIEDPQRGLWIGTNDGLNHFDGQTFTRYEHDPNDPESISGNSISGLYPDNKGGLWLSIQGVGVDYFDGQTFTHYQFDETDPSGLNTQYLSQIIKDPNSENFWFASADKGLLRLDAATNTFAHFLPAPEQPEDITLNRVGTIYQDESGMIWLGGSSGLLLFDPGTEQFIRRYTKNDGLADNIVSGIIGDNQGQLWVSTNSGLSRFDPQSETFRNYDEADGLQSNQFIGHSIAKAADGQIFVGGVNGLNAFYPDRLPDNPNLPPVVLTGFELFNQPVVIGAEDSPLKQAINVTDELILSYDQSVFTFKFAALNYTLPEKNQYAYMIEGFDDEWRFTTVDRRFATYTNLNPGSYTFRVKASNNDGAWNEEGISLPITITPPWWRTWWMYTLIIIAVIGSILGYIKWRTQAVNVRSKELEITVDKRTKELKAAKEESDIAKDQAEIANRAKSEFLANMSHEIRTPLNAILGFSEVLKNLENEPKKTHYLETIHKSGKALLSLINDILDLSKIEAGRIELQYFPVSIQQFLLELETVFKLKADDLGLELRTKINNPHQYSLVLDESRLRQIILNLISNAIKFTDQGSISIFAEICKKEESSQSRVDLTISVKDTGIGIAPDQQEKIFESFEQVSGQKLVKYGGTGLGLAISRRITELMNGKLTVKSELGKGSTFTLYIPDIEVATTKGSLHEASKRVHFESITFEPATILIVDDIDYNRELLTSYLSPWKFTVLAAENGKIALEQIQQNQPDIILMDMKMPVMDGYEATDILKDDPEFKATPIIAITASALKEDEVQISKICEGYLRKPISQSDLVEQLARFLPYTQKPMEPTQDALRDKKITGPLVPPSENELSVLYELAQIGNMSAIQKRADYIAALDEKYIPFADNLRRLAEDIALEAILKMMEEFINGDKNNEYSQNA